MKIRVIAGFCKANVLKPLFEKYGKVTLIEENTSDSAIGYGRVTCFFEMSDEDGKTAIEALDGSDVPRFNAPIQALKWD